MTTTIFYCPKCGNVTKCPGNTVSNKERFWCKYCSISWEVILRQYVEERVGTEETTRKIKFVWDGFHITFNASRISEMSSIVDHGDFFEFQDEEGNMVAEIGVKWSNSIYKSLKHLIDVHFGRKMPVSYGEIQPINKDETWE